MRSDATGKNAIGILDAVTGGTGIWERHTKLQTGQTHKFKETTVVHQIRLTNALPYRMVISIHPLRY